MPRPKPYTVFTELRRRSLKFAALLDAMPWLEAAQVDVGDASTFSTRLSTSVSGAKTYRESLAKLRREWSTIVVGIACGEVTGEIDIKSSKLLQTALAEAAISAALQIAGDESNESDQLKILAVGKLAAGGLDYESDLDVVAVYDDRALSNPIEETANKFSRQAERLVSILSSLTREGSLYRVDMRLRPHGKNGPLAVSRSAFEDYVSDEAAIWELLAYVKLRSIGGDPAGDQIEQEIRGRVHAKALLIEPEELRLESARVRSMLEKNKSGRLRTNDVDIKYGPGGMLDVYFVVRYLQLRDDIHDGGDDRSTVRTLVNLRENGSLNEEVYEALVKGYVLLRSIDHSLRFVLGRTGRLPLGNLEAMARIVNELGYKSVATLLEELTLARIEIRDQYENILT